MSDGKSKIADCGASRAHWNPIRRRTYLLVFAVALLARAGWGLYRISGSGAETLEFPDEEQYWLMANSLRDGQGLRDELGFQATRMPLYPGLLALASGLPHGILWGRAAQWLIGASGAILAMVLGRRIAGPRVGVIAGLFFALDPFLIFFSSLLLTETLFVTLLVGLWACAAPLVVQRSDTGTRRWLLITLLSVACVYARESTLGLIALGAALFLIARRFEKRALGGILMLTLGMVIGLLPWAARNQRVLGEWCWLTTRSGISLYDGVRPGATGASDLADVKSGAAVQGLSESQWNRYFLNEAFRHVREEPGRIAALAARKVMRMWNPVPNVETYRSTLVRLISAGWMILLLLFALAGIVFAGCFGPNRATSIVVFLLLPAIYLTGLHALFVPSVRYRLGAMPMIAVLAAMGMARLIRRTRPTIADHA